mmetsp:Transcript_20295/g.48114  ORF Transcript_20295/g.48114 Transcript_20295/m.48114 type:complete len:598 (+) Transcript_20295:64-1857(+)
MTGSWRRQQIAICFILLLAGHEAVRTQHAIEEAALHVGASGKEQDLDWAGCGKQSLLCSTEGCARQYLWLDTPRQSCRYTEEYKLTHNQPVFLDVELGRLEEKSEKFAKDGCIMGGRWFKCQRRVKQMIRILKYVKKGLQQARADPTNPAHEMASSAEVRQRMVQVGENIGTGFEASKELSGQGLQFKEALRQMLQVGQEPEPTVEPNETDVDENITEEADSSADAAAVSAMLTMVGVTLNTEQKATLMTNMESHADSMDDTSEDEVVEALDEDIGNTLMAYTEEEGLAEGLPPGRAVELAAQRKGNFSSEVSETDTGGDEDLESNETASLLELAGGQELMSGDGPLKILWYKGLGWLVSRIAWLFLFLVGAAWGVFRAGLVFPLLFVGCTALKFLWWLGRGVGYHGLWEGNGTKVVKGFKRIGKCAPWMWEAVGFTATSNMKEIPGQVFIPPARFASRVTGVYHATKELGDLCTNVTCGVNAGCHAGTCRCLTGFYPAQGEFSCGPLVTESGCVCKTIWESRARRFFGASYAGCPRWSMCKVDTAHPSYSLCRKRLPTKGLFFKSPRSKDRCMFQDLNAKRRALPVEMAETRPVVK